MPAPVQREDFGFPQGETGSLAHFEVKNGQGAAFDFTGYTLLCQVRASAESLTVICEPIVAIEGPASDGKIELQFTAAMSGVMFGTVAYDIFASHATLPSVRVVEGLIEVSPRVSWAA